MSVCYCTDTKPDDALTSSGYRPTPDENGEVLITVDVGEEAPLYLIEFVFWNIQTGSDVQISVMNDSGAPVEVREVG